MIKIWWEPVWLEKFSTSVHRERCVKTAKSRSSPRSWTSRRHVASASFLFSLFRYKIYNSTPLCLRRRRRRRLTHSLDRVINDVDVVRFFLRQGFNFDIIASRLVKLVSRPRKRERERWKKIWQRNFWQNWISCRFIITWSSTICPSVRKGKKIKNRFSCVKNYHVRKMIW